MDSITALAAATLMMLANGAVLAFMRRHLPSDLQPFAYIWQAATFAIALGCMIFPFYLHIPLPLASVLANGPLLVGLAGYWHALRRFYGRPDIINLMTIVVVVTLLGLFWFSAVQPDTRIRIMIVSATWLLFMGGSFLTLKNAMQPDTTRSHWALLSIFGLVTLFTAIRSVYYAMLDIQPGFNIIDNSSVMNLLTPMVAVVLPIIGTTAFVLLLLERMRSEAAVSQASLTDKKNLEQLSYLGHDLRAPLSTIVGYARLLSQTQTAEQASHLRAIERSASYQMELIDEMLDHAKRALQPLGIRLQPTQMKSLLEDVVQHGKSLSGQQHNRFEFTAATPLPELIHSDPRRLQQILLNLISNAAKFTRKGQIRFIVSAKPGPANQTALTFVVSDTGSGISPQDQQAIFNAFEQRDERPGSVGLGLYIARTAIRNMGGELILDSAPGTGSSFSVHLPAQILSENTITLPTQVWDSSPTPKTTSALPSTPTAAVLQTLASLAANGELSEIERWIEAQNREQPTHSDFYDQVHLALQRLDFTRIELLAGIKA
ncbi:HAMP domain-containing sensor histidine kinase [Pusillimonas sp. ANT_WB101]|uniref:sensor histidine kinase n=1 Tax=Pusillimonas sp. ANT_WB101 TaxID=2597356 RepID=UPI0011EF17FD|nr:HAMP domain-containing sensor histidine kinase [Pusillimonas sp. ANT_WB101]KAA0910845.1 HAMP domain-containing histidine kinase [Pusillimonas sp. ANT_WB101]